MFSSREAVTLPCHIVHPHDEPTSHTTLLLGLYAAISPSIGIHQQHGSRLYERRELDMKHSGDCIAGRTIGRSHHREGTGFGVHNRTGRWPHPLPEDQAFPSLRVGDTQHSGRREGQCGHDGKGERQRVAA